MVEGSLDVGGAGGLWGRAGAADPAKLAPGFPPLGLEALVPDPRRASAVLRDALEDVFGGPRVLVRPLAARDGFAVVTEDRGAAANTYATALVARAGPGDPPAL